MSNICIKALELKVGLLETPSSSLNWLTNKTSSSEFLVYLIYPQSKGLPVVEFALQGFERDTVPGGR
jgi:hypothetical protein